MFEYFTLLVILSFEIFKIRNILMELFLNVQSVAVVSVCAYKIYMWLCVGEICMCMNAIITFFLLHFKFEICTYIYFFSNGISMNR